MWLVWIHLRLEMRGRQMGHRRLERPKFILAKSRRWSENRTINHSSFSKRHGSRSKRPPKCDSFADSRPTRGSSSVGETAASTCLPRLGGRKVFNRKCLWQHVGCSMLVRVLRRRTHCVYHSDGCLLCANITDCRLGCSQGSQPEPSENHINATKTRSRMPKASRQTCYFTEKLNGYINRAGELGSWAQHTSMARVSSVSLHWTWPV